MERRIRKHSTRLSAAATDVSYAAFMVGTRVMTLDNRPGRITAVQEGGWPQAEQYEVTLDNGLGGGLYSASQLRALSDSAPHGTDAHLPAGLRPQASMTEMEYNAGLHEAGFSALASDDYPELGTILHDRPDPASQIKIIGARVAPLFSARTGSVRGPGEIPVGEFSFTHIKNRRNPDFHTIVARHPDAADNYGYRNGAGYLHWSHDAGSISDINVTPQFRHNGVATEMARRAQQITPGLSHSSERSEAADGWAAQTGLPVPELTRRVTDGMERYSGRLAHKMTWGNEDGDPDDHNEDWCPSCRAHHPEGEHTSARLAAWYHGTGYELNPGDRLTPEKADELGRVYDARDKHVFFTDSPVHAQTFAMGAANAHNQLWPHEKQTPRVYQVEPEGGYDEDPNLPGMSAYRTKSLRVIREHTSARKTADWDHDTSPDPVDLYHGTNKKFNPGEHIEPGHETNYPGAYDGEEEEAQRHVHATPLIGAAWKHADNAVHEHGGEHHVYEVEPTGHVSWGSEAFPEDYESDDDMHYQADRMSTSPFRVKRELPYQGEHLPYTHLERPVQGLESYHRQAAAFQAIASRLAEAGVPMPGGQMKLFDMPHEKKPEDCPECGYERHDPEHSAMHLMHVQKERGDYEPQECEHCGGDLNDREGHEEEHLGWLHAQDWHTDWDAEELPRTLHRGLGIALPPDLHKHVHDESVPVHERGKALLDHVLRDQSKGSDRGGLGNFWSGDADVSKSYAESATRRYSRHGDQTPVMLHAHMPSREHIETDPDTLQHWGVYSYHLAGNREVPIQNQAPLRIKGISWAPPNHGRLSGAVHGHETPDHLEDDPAWTHHETGGEGIRAHAMATDWDQSHDKIPGEIHRGLYAPESRGVFSVPMSDEDIAHGLIAAHQEEQFPYERDQHKLFGTHWSSDEGVARSFAQEHEREHHEDDFQCPDHDEHHEAAPVVFHAQRPQRHEIETDPRRLGWQNVDDYGTHEKEVPIRHGAPVRLTGVSWLKHTGLGPVWHRHDFREPVDLRAHDNDSPSDPNQWNASLHAATTINGTQIDEHGDAPDHGSNPDHARAAGPDAYDAESTEGQGDPKWSEPLPGVSKKDSNGAQIGMYPEGMEGGGGPGLSIGGFTAAVNPHVYYHGTPDVRHWERGAAYGLHVGTQEAARQALHARLGRPHEGEWDGTREYGKTLLSPDQSTGYERDLPEPRLPSGAAVYSNGDKVPPDARPHIFPVRIKGPMINSPAIPVEDDYANSRMHGQITRGNAKRGYYYRNIGEDEGSISAVVPSAAHLERVHPEHTASRQVDWHHMEEAHGVRLQPGGKMPSGDFLAGLHDRFHGGQVADNRLIPHSHQEPGTTAAPPGHGDAISRFFTHAPAQERAPAPEPESEPLDDREYSIRDVSRHYGWEGFDSHEISHLVHRPERATFTHEDVPVKSLRHVDEHGQLTAASSYHDLASQGEDEQERLHEIERGYDEGAPIPPIVVVRHGKHHIIADGSHRAAVHARRGSSYIPAFVTDRTIFPEGHPEHTAASDANQREMDKGDRFHEFKNTTQDLHRGISVRLPPALHDYVHDEGNPREDRADALQNHFQRDGLGMHWTPHVDIAHRSIGNAVSAGHSGYDSSDLFSPPGSLTEIMFHARHPAQKSIVRNKQQLEEHDVGHEFSPDEDETPVKPNSPMFLTGISWRQHDPEHSMAAYEHHDFPKAIRHEAGKRPWTDAERVKLHAWSNGDGANEGDFVSSHNFTNKQPTGFQDLYPEEIPPPDPLPASEGRLHCGTNKGNPGFYDLASRSPEVGPRAFLDHVLAGMTIHISDDDEDEKALKDGQEPSGAENPQEEAPDPLQNAVMPSEHDDEANDLDSGGDNPWDNQQDSEQDKNSLDSGDPQLSGPGGTGTSPVSPLDAAPGADRGEFVTKGGPPMTEGGTPGGKQPPPWDEKGNPVTQPGQEEDEGNPFADNDDDDGTHGTADGTGPEGGRPWEAGSPGTAPAGEDKNLAGEIRDGAPAGRVPQQSEGPAAGAVPPDPDEPPSKVNGRPSPADKKKAIAMFRQAALSPAFRFEFTAAWKDVLAKAQRLRKAGRVRITAVGAGYVIGEVGGDHDVYESSVQRYPGKPNSIMAFACGCPWGSFHQDKDYPGHLNGRCCSHAYALHLESLSRRMYQEPAMTPGTFRRDVIRDPADPDWRPREVVVKSMPPWGPGGWRETWTAPATSVPFRAALRKAADDDAGDPEGEGEQDDQDALDSLKMAASVHVARRVLLDAGEPPEDVGLLMMVAGLERTATAKADFRIRAYHWQGTLSHLVAYAETPTKEDAAEIAGQFPKSVGVKQSGWGLPPEHRQNAVTWTVKLTPDGNNAGANENGIKRYRALRKHIDRLGHTATWAPDNATNSVKTEPEFEKMVSAYGKTAARERRKPLGDNDHECWKCGARRDKSEMEPGSIYAPVLGAAWQCKDASECQSNRDNGRYRTAAADHDTYYHLTDDPKFSLDPRHEPHDNSFSVHPRSGAGVYLTKHPESWVNGHDYVRPYVAEIHAHPSVHDDEETNSRWGGEKFVPGEHFDKLHVHRVIPLDAHVREEYGAHGWIEKHHGTEFDTGAPLRKNPENRHYPFCPKWNDPSAYRYPGPDVRDMSKEETDRHKGRWLGYLKDNRGFGDEDIEYYRQHTGAANDPWGSNNYAAHAPQKPYGATSQPDKDMDPGSYGFLAGPDPEEWGEIQDESPTQTSSISSTEGALAIRSWDHKGTGYFLRFGDWPDNERSRNNVTGYPEFGVSAYDLNHKGEPEDPDPRYERGHEHTEECDPDCDLDQDNDDYSNDPGEEMHGRVRRAEKNRYNGNDNSGDTAHIVRGDVAGLGHDAEPLLTNVKRVGDWIDHRHILLPGAKPHRLARSPDNEDYEPPEEHPHGVTAASVPDPAPSDLDYPAIRDWQNEDQDSMPYQTNTAGPYDAMSPGDPDGIQMGGALAAGTAQPHSPGEPQMQGGLGAELKDEPEPALPGTTADVMAWAEQKRAAVRRALGMGEPLDGGPGAGGSDDSLEPDDQSIQTVGQAQWSGAGSDADEMGAGGHQRADGRSEAPPDDDEVLTRFHMSAAASLYQPGGESGPGADLDIAGAARAYLQKTAQAHFSAEEAESLIAEGRGQRARNLDLLDVKGTHYEDNDDQVEKRGLSLDDYDDDLALT